MEFLLIPAAIVLFASALLSGLSTTAILYDIKVSGVFIVLHIVSFVAGAVMLFLAVHWVWALCGLVGYWLFVITIATPISAKLLRGK
ncbi:hypothetical protein ES703_62013 [subsurface metagenome]